MQLLILDGIFGAGCTIIYRVAIRDEGMSIKSSGMKDFNMRLKNLSAILFFTILCGVAVPSRADTPTTQPAGDPSAATVGELQLRANQAMAKSDYAGALPILQKISQKLSDKPDQLGPVLEQIRVCRRMIANAAKSAAAGTPAVNPNANPGAPLTGATTMPSDPEARKPHPAVKVGEVMDLPIKDLGNFEYDAEKGGNIPADVKSLEGCKFRTRGYMVPLDQAEKISQFALVPSLFACCFGQPPQIQHTIIVQTPKGLALSYYPDELVVEGTLHVSEQKDGGFIVSMFQMDASSVHSAAK
jgi:hypothetical protein